MIATLNEKSGHHYALERTVSLNLVARIMKDMLSVTTDKQAGMLQASSPSDSAQDFMRVMATYP